MNNERREIVARSYEVSAYSTLKVKGEKYVVDARLSLFHRQEG